MGASKSRLLVFPFTLLAALVLFIPSAFADTPAEKVPGWQFGEVMALIALIVAAAGMLVDAARLILHFTAPRTKTLLDDQWAARLDRMHERITVIETQIPRPSSSSSVGPAALLTLVVLGLAGVGDAACGGGGAGGAGGELGHKTGVALVDCTAASAAAIGSAVASMRADVSDGGCSSKSAEGARSTDWKCVRGKAISAGLAIGGCAFLELVSSSSGTSARALVAAPDDGRAAFEEYRAGVAGGARFLTAAGER